MNVRKMSEACLKSNRALLTHGASETVAETRPEAARWYALKVRTRAEFAALAALQSRGYDPYCPTRLERRRYSDRMKAVETAVFPGYLFCKFDVQKKVPIVSSHGVEYIVGTAGAPAAIPDSEIINLQRAVTAGASASPYFKAGQRVRITHGPLTGVEGILARNPQGDRLVVSVELLNRSVSIQIEEAQCALAE
jgi:transcription antitermination factor NusG